MKFHFFIAVLFVVSCSDENKPMSSRAVQPELGSVRFGTNEMVSLLYGGPSTAESPNLFSMGHEALICDTPSRLSVNREFDGDAIFTTAVRCTTVPNKPLMFMVLQKTGTKVSVLKSLTVNDSQWHPIRIAVSSSCQEVTVTASYELPAESKNAGPEIAWATPQFNKPNHAEQPDVIFISIDTMRSSALAHAPFLSSLISTGRHYINAYSPSNWTLPSFASLVSGLTPQQHHCTRGPFSAVATEVGEERNFYSLDNRPTFAKAFRDSGYATAFIHQNPFLESWTNIQQGFEMFARTADRVDSSQDIALSWWNDNKHRNRLMLLHFMEPHWPYTNENDAQRFFKKNINDFLVKDNTPQQRRDFFAVNESVKDEVHAAYNQQIKILDKQLELMVSELSKSSQNYVVVIHVDHGEELWDQGSFEHGHSFADCVVKVPLAIIHPGSIHSEQITTPVPAHHIGSYLVEYLNLNSDMPPSALGNSSDADRTVTSTHSLYRCDIGGKTIHPDGSYSVIPNSQLDYQGQNAEIPGDVQAALLQLGYSGD